MWPMIFLKAVFMSLLSKCRHLVAPLVYSPHLFNMCSYSTTSPFSLVLFLPHSLRYLNEAWFSQPRCLLIFPMTTLGTFTSSSLLTQWSVLCPTVVVGISQFLGIQQYFGGLSNFPTKNIFCGFCCRMFLLKSMSSFIVWSVVLSRSLRPHTALGPA